MAAWQTTRERPAPRAAADTDFWRRAMGDKSPKNKEKRKPKKTSEKKK